MVTNYIITSYVQRHHQQKQKLLSYQSHILWRFNLILQCDSDTVTARTQIFFCKHSTQVFCGCVETVSIHMHFCQHDAFCPPLGQKVLILLLLMLLRQTPPVGTIFSFLDIYSPNLKSLYKNTKTHLAILPTNLRSFKSLKKCQDYK